MTIAVTGASGFIGRALCRSLTERGHRVVALGRNPGALRDVSAAERRRFDAMDGAPNPKAFEGADAVVHLAGESIAGRWNAAKKRAIYDSRVTGTRLLVRSLERLPRRPRVLVSASAVGYYGARGDEPLEESASAGTGFLADVCRDWEREARAAEALGVRTVRMRTGVVLGSGGALPKMAGPFRLGAGGPLGSGRQFVPWIALRDLVGLYEFAVAQSRLEGAINAVTPDYATSARLAGAIGSALGRPALAPAPAFALRTMLGEFAQTLLDSQLVVPAVAEDAGFNWERSHLEATVREALVPLRAGHSNVRSFHTEQRVEGKLNDVFSFFARAQNLEAITPPWLHFGIDAAPAGLQRGAQIDYHLRLHGLPLHWRTMIARWRPPYEFVDVQLHGPYALWRHTHRFEPINGATLVSDHVDYALPLWPLGTIGSALVERDVLDIFNYRSRIVAEIFARRQNGRTPYAATA